MTDLLQHALSYAGLGLEIFPVNHTNKRPHHSQLDATTDLDQIEAWWKRWPDALIGHRIAPDVVLLDVDPRHGGKATWNALRVEANGVRPRAHHSGRGDGGVHIWFKRPAKRIAISKLDKWAEERGLGSDKGTRWTGGIDLLTHEHRYTILPPSPHPETDKPYWWAPGRGLNVDPGLMPTFLAELLVKDELPPAPVRMGPQFRQVDSIADWFSENHYWGQILEPHGWTLVNGDGDQDGSEWRHPQATNEHSATTRNGCLFVYSPNTPFEPTESDDTHGYTRFRAYAVLNHSGDLSAAGGHARRLKGAAVVQSTTPGRPEGSGGTPGTQEPVSGAHTGLERVSMEHLEAFWTQMPQLARIRDFARARRCSPWAMLGVILARVAAATPSFVTLPPLIGGHLSLNFYVVLVGGSGSGKDAAITAGGDAFEPQGAIDFEQIGLGSGEGILDQYVVLEPANKDTGDPAYFRQHTESVLFSNPEIETVAALKGRSNATLMPMLRDAWMGSKLGFAYRATEKRATLGAHHYRLCLILGSQPGSAGALLDEQTVGTPQRFLWLPVHDPIAPDVAPEVPEMPVWRLPQWPTATDGKVTLGLCKEAAEAIDAARTARLRGDEGDDTPDGHALACREKVGALLAILFGQTYVDLKIWSMAGIIGTMSFRTREMARSAVASEHSRSNKARGYAAAERQKIVTETTEDLGVQKCCRRVELLLTRKGDWYPFRNLKQDVGYTHRSYLEEALDLLITAGKAIEEEYKAGGNAGKRYKAT